MRNAKVSVTDVKKLIHGKATQQNTKAAMLEGGFTTAMFVVTSLSWRVLN